MDLDHLPPQLRAVLGSLTGAVRTREPAILAKVGQVRPDYPHYDNHQLSLELIRSTRRRVRRRAP